MPHPLAALAILAFLAWTGPAHAAPLDGGALRVGVDGNQPPFSQTLDDGSWQGFTIDITRAMCARMRTSCTFVATSIAEAEPQLHNRAVDLVPGLAVTAQRQRSLDFTAPYFSAASRFVASRDRSIAVSPEGLAGKVVGVQRGSVQASFAAATYPGIVLRHYGGTAELYIDLALGRLVNMVLVRAQFLSTPLGAGFDFAGPVLDDPVWFGKGVGIAVRRGDSQLLTALDEALRAIRADGTFEAVSADYFGFSIDGS